jgi:hypothetical protein
MNMISPVVFKVDRSIDPENGYELNAVPVAVLMQYNRIRQHGLHDGASCRAESFVL